MHDRLLTVGTDGACLGNPGPAGWAWVDEHGSYHSSGLAVGTNNIAELRAVLDALLDHPDVPHLVIQIDSTYARDCSTTWRAAWQRNGKIRVFHYTEGRMRDIRYQLVRDAEGFEPAPDVKQPALVFHGLKDDVVPAGYSSEFAAAHPENVKLRLLDSGHELTDVLDLIWQESEAFLIHW